MPEYDAGTAWQGTEVRRRKGRFVCFFLVFSRLRYSDEGSSGGRSDATTCRRLSPDLRNNLDFGPRHVDHPRGWFRSSHAIFNFYSLPGPPRMRSIWLLAAALVKRLTFGKSMHLVCKSAHQTGKSSHLSKIFSWLYSVLAVANILKGL